MVRKIKLLVLIVFVLVLISVTNVYAKDVTQKLYQDITINLDGSITVREAALLDGTYNGRDRQIEFKNYNATTFTGAYSNFTGNTDIYDGSSIKDIKVFDISQDKFETITDVQKTEKIYKEVQSASKGNYGVYTLSKNDRRADFRIYCPSKKKKVFGIEYTITDAVVIHNDVAELYWNVLGDAYREDISDFQVVVHLPKDSSDLRVWTHGPLTGANKIVDNKTVYFKDTKVPSYTAETIRIMFDKDILTYATKKSGVNGKENILKYEQAMADSANAEREKQKLEKMNEAEDAILELESKKKIYYYNRAIKLVNQLQAGTQKQEYLGRIEKVKEAVNLNWKKSIQDKIESITLNNYVGLNERQLRNLQSSIKEGFDEQAKKEYLEMIPILKNVLEQRYSKIRKNCTTIVVTAYIIFGIIVIFKLIKIFDEKHRYSGKYYRDFPSEDNPYVIEYLMKRKITNLSFSATILNLIAKKVIVYEKVPNNDKDLKLILQDKSYVGNKAEIVVLDVLFNLVGGNDICYINQLKIYGNLETRAKKLTKKMDEFKKEAKAEANEKKYFAGNATIIEKVIMGLIIFWSLVLTIGVFYKLNYANLGIDILKYIGIVTILGIAYFVVIDQDKHRTSIGKVEYSKWLAHKRYLKDFSNFDEKDLPEITLWEKYLVTATVLGCADKVQEKMKMYINDNNTTSNYLLLASLNSNIITTINRSVDTSINTARYTISASSSSSSSGGGFGGGSSHGRRPEEAGGGGGRKILKRNMST